MVDRHSGVVDDPVHHAEGGGLRYPAVIVDRPRPVAAARRVELIDRDHLARLRVGQQIVVMESPPSGGIAAESAARERRIMTAARLYIQNPHREHVARFGIPHKDRTGANMDAEPLAGAAPMGLTRSSARRPAGRHSWRPWSKERRSPPQGLPRSFAHGRRKHDGSAFRW